MASLKDVAKLAGVSSMTVSRVLNNNYPVSPEARRQVMEAVRTLEYEPNVMGRNLRKAKARTILVVGLGFVERIMNGIYEAARKLDYEVILMHTRYFEKDDYARRLRNGMASGILFMNMPDESVISETSKRFPVVQCGSAASMASGCWVSIDEEKAAQEMTNLLISEGRKRIALVSTVFEDGTIYQLSRWRQAGFRKALAESGLIEHPDLIFTSAFLRENITPAFNLARTYADMPPNKRPDAILCEQSTMAAAMIGTFNEAGLDIPGDIAIACLDDQPINQIVRPDITAIKYPYEQMGHESMQLLAGLIEAPNKPSRQIFYDHDLAQRGSTNSST